eukprot:1388003-Heterocapsa_arctica.AAC.1
MATVSIGGRKRRERITPSLQGGRRRRNSPLSPLMERVRRQRPLWVRAYISASISEQFNVINRTDNFRLIK